LRPDCHAGRRPAMLKGRHWDRRPFEPATAGRSAPDSSVFRSSAHTSPRLCLHQVIARCLTPAQDRAVAAVRRSAAGCRRTRLWGRRPRPFGPHAATAEMPKSREETSWTSIPLPRANCTRLGATRKPRPSGAPAEMCSRPGSRLRIRLGDHCWNLIPPFGMFRRFQFDSVAGYPFIGLCPRQGLPVEV